MPKGILVSKIRIDGGTQCRSAINQSTVGEYAEAIKAFDKFPPVTVFFDGVDYWLADGFHRFHAHIAANEPEIDSEVIKGTKRDAVLYSLGANAIHGLQRTNADKRKAVQTMLDDPEWSQWSDVVIAQKCAVGTTLVGTMRKEASIITPRDDAAATRKVTRGGKTYEQDITKLANKSQAKQESSPLDDRDSVFHSREPVPDKAPSSSAKTEEPDASDEEIASEQAADYEAVVNENAALTEEASRLRGIISSNDANAKLLSEIDKLKEINRVQKDRIDGLMEEKRQAVNRAKSLEGQVKSLEKKLKEATKGVDF